MPLSIAQFGPRWQRRKGVSLRMNTLLRNLHFKERENERRF